ncbi:MAG: hypothetical protein G8345_13765 [Magnetococcales bacterium]|nr:hypothetical protein [Magnetococcales bacterium]NGZ27942.1 hypothetical protein [Magnetococcales bacterium]
MKLANSPSFLATNIDDNGKIVLKICNTYNKIGDDWGLAARLSPIWGLSIKNELEDPKHQLPLDKGFVCFLGMIHPHLVFNGMPDLCKNNQMYLSLGHYNVILGVREERDVCAVEKWCQNGIYSAPHLENYP